MPSVLALKIAAAAALGLGVADLVWLDARVLPAVLAQRSEGGAARSSSDRRVARDSDLDRRAVERGGSAVGTGVAPDAPPPLATGSALGAAGAESSSRPSAESGRVAGAAGAESSSRPSAESGRVAGAAGAESSSRPSAESGRPAAAAAAVGAGAAAGSLDAGDGRVTLYFESMSKRVGRRASAELARLVHRAGARVAIEVVGYSDAAGEEGYNLRLSRARAEAVTTALVRLGVSPARIRSDYRGEGDAQSAEAERWRDRRADIRVLEGGVR